MLKKLYSVEMRHSVTTPSYVFKKTIDGMLYYLTSRRDLPLATLVPLLSRDPFPSDEPSGWLPLYTMVTFRPDIGYAKARRKAERQSRILSNVGWLGAIVLITTTLGFRWVKTFCRS
jgi:kynurenine 3-monooxygenase